MKLVISTIVLCVITIAAAILQEAPYYAIQKEYGVYVARDLHNFAVIVFFVVAVFVYYKVNK